MCFLEEDLRGEQSFRDDGIVGTPTQQSLLRIRDGDVGATRVDTIGQLHDMNCPFHDDQHAVAQAHHFCDLAVVWRADLHRHCRIANLVDVAAASFVVSHGWLEYRKWHDISFQVPRHYKQSNASRTGICRGMTMTLKHNSPAFRPTCTHIWTEIPLRQLRGSTRWMIRSSAKSTLPLCEQAATSKAVCY